MLLQTVMNESQKRRQNSICMFTSSSSAASSSLPLYYLTSMSMTSVFAVTTSHTLTITSHSVVVPFTRITFLHSTFSRHMRIQSKKKHGWRAGGKPQSHLFFGAALCHIYNRIQSSWESRTQNLFPFSEGIAIKTPFSIISGGLLPVSLSSRSVSSASASTDSQKGRISSMSVSF